MSAIILLITCGLILVVNFFMLIRNNWVYNQRMFIINYRFSEYDDFLSYDEMMDKFWIWDIAKLKKEAK